MTGFINDINAVTSQLANDQSHQIDLAYDANVIEYDVETNMARVLLNTLRQEDDDSSDSGSSGGSSQPSYIETGWSPVASPVVGKNWGFQHCLKGGATQDNPDEGEQVTFLLLDRIEGLGIVVAAHFNDTMPPPGAGPDSTSDGSGSGASSSSGGAGGSSASTSSSPDPESDNDGSQKLQPGESILKHESGSFLKFYEDGSVRVNSRETLYLQVKQDVNIVVEEGNVIADVQKGNVTATVDQGNLSVDVKQGSIDVTADEKDITFNATKGNFNVNCGGDYVVMAGGEYQVTEGVPPTPPPGVP